ncbi:hypothetical protein PR001_g31608 [Phytophthora rubi]|uniref:Uncharacterized protein n=1 Tax=Phytophthora rubi TaxID=129364 RepID=A0A6A3GIV0_9STRA|nr:hypothetical protein PR001_g31608 [Phytophthora rubi]
MGHFNQKESMTLVTTPEDLPYWTTIKPMILPKSVPINRVLAPVSREMVVVEEYGDFDHFDQGMELVPPPTLL